MFRLSSDELLQRVFLLLFDLLLRNICIRHGVYTLSVVPLVVVGDDSYSEVAGLIKEAALPGMATNKRLREGEHACKILLDNGGSLSFLPKELESQRLGDIAYGYP